jgi:flagellar hook-length control protein FliK
VIEALHDTTAPLSGSRRDATPDVGPASFDAMVTHVAQRQRSARVAQEIAGENRRAQENKRLTDADLRPPQPRHDPQDTVETVPTESNRIESAQPNPVAAGEIAVLNGAPSQQSGSPGGSDAARIDHFLVAGSQRVPDSDAPTAQRKARSRVGRSGGHGDARIASARSGPVVLGQAALARPGMSAASRPGAADSTAAASERPSRPPRLAAPKSPQPARPMTPVQQRRTIEEVLRVLKLKATERHSFVRLQLSPPELGQLMIDVRMDDDQMRIRIEATTRDAQELLESRVDLLTTALRDKGVEIDQFEVHLDESFDAADRSDPQRRDPHGSDEHDLSEEAATVAQDDIEPLRESHPWLEPGHVDITA